MLIAFTDGDFPWALFPLVCWGTGLTIHYIYGFRRAAMAAQARQRYVEAYADRTKEPAPPCTGRRGFGAAPTASKEET